MAAEKGRAFVLKVSNGATTPSFSTLGGLRTTGLTINNEAVDVTDKDSAGIQELLAQAGVQQVTITGAGVFKDTASEELVREIADENRIETFRVQFESGNYYEGDFQIENFEQSGEYNGARQYSLGLRRSGPWTYTEA